MRARVINDVIRGMEEAMLRVGDRVMYQGHELEYTHMGWYTGHYYFEVVGRDQEVCIPHQNIHTVRRVEHGV